jgi:hypothetical protein
MRRAETVAEKSADRILDSIAALTKSHEARMEDVKGRLDRGEGGMKGLSSMGALILGIVVVLGVIAGIVIPLLKP